MARTHVDGQGHRARLFRGQQVRRPSSPRYAVTDEMPGFVEPTRRVRRQCRCDVICGSINPPTPGSRRNATTNVSRRSMAHPSADLPHGRSHWDSISLNSIARSTPTSRRSSTSPRWSAWGPALMQASGPIASSGDSSASRASRCSKSVSPLARLATSVMASAPLRCGRCPWSPSPR